VVRTVSYTQQSRGFLPEQKTVRGGRGKLFKDGCVGGAPAVSRSEGEAPDLAGGWGAWGAIGGLGLSRAISPTPLRPWELVGWVRTARSLNSRRYAARPWRVSHHCFRSAHSTMRRLITSRRPSASARSGQFPADDAWPRSAIPCRWLSPTGSMRAARSTGIRSVFAGCRSPHLFTCRFCLRHDRGLSPFCGRGNDFALRHVERKFDQPANGSGAAQDYGSRDLSKAGPILVSRAIKL
jgi:hypothetical protein